MKFLICYDDSETCKNLIKEAIKYAEKMDANLEVVYVMSISYTVKPTEIPKAEAEFEKKVKSFFGNAKVPYVAQMLISNEPAAEILTDYAKTNKFDRIFVGVEKRSKVGKLLMGSTAQGIILNASCPVVTVK